MSANWDALVATLAREHCAGALQAAPGPTVQGVLAAPVAIARWIASSQPVLAERDCLRLVVIGAEKLDAVDAGRWYQWLPALLGSPGRVEVTLIGDRLQTRFESPLRAQAPARAAELRIGTLADCSSAITPGGYDLAVLFHPGFQKHRGWLTDGSLAHVLAAGIPLLAASFEADEYEMDRWVIECYGFSVAGALVLNPLCVDLSEADAVVHWGGALWQFGPAIPAAGHAIDRERLAALDRLGDMVMHSLLLRLRPHAPYGVAVQARTAQGGTRALIYLFDDYFVDPLDGTVLALSGADFKPLARLDADELARHPGAEASALANAVWAAGVKYRRLLGTYPAIDAEARRTSAGAMHASLEDKIQRLFEP
ncbi:MAG: hypothetical protein IT531_20030 [Burkholderiales bacterium]|nr:hypothetical protein [Burkholderiales bacterium]